MRTQTDTQILESLGKSIFKYFYSITKENQEFYLFVDEFLFERFVDESGNSMEDVLRALNNYKCSTNKPLVAISIISFQVKILYDLSVIDDNSYYSQLRANYKSLSYLDDVAILNNFFYGGSTSLGNAAGEKIWTLAQNLFKEYKRNLVVASFHNYTGRFVDLPKLHRIYLNGKNVRNFLIAYADIFINRKIEPNQFLSFNEFLKLLGQTPERIKQNLNENARYHLIFNFYNIWDGRNSYSYRNVSKIVRNGRIREKEEENLDEYIIQYFSKSEYKIFKNKQELESAIEKQKALSLFSSKKYVFVRYSKNSNYWINIKNSYEKKSNIKEKLEVFENGNASSFFLCNGRRFNFVISEYKQEKRIFEVVGGIKVKGFHNVWYSFALPTVKISNCKYIRINVDGKKYELNDFEDETYGKIKIIKIKKEMLSDFENPNKRHRINISDSSDFYFYIDKKKEEKIEYKSSGWNLNGQDLILKIFESQADDKKADIDGYSINNELIFAPSEESKVDFDTINRRKFIQHLQRFETKISIGNTKIEEWKKYGR